MTATEYTKRRQHVLEEIKAGYVISGFTTMQQTNDSSAPFIQESNFYYLTGINEPDWQLMVTSEGKSVLVAPETSEVARIFDGELTFGEAQRVSGVETVVSMKEVKTLLKSHLKSQSIKGVVVPNPRDSYTSFTLNPAPQRLFKEVLKAIPKPIDIRPVLAKMRGRKDPSEIKAIRQAVHSTCRAFEKVKKSLNKAEYEYNLEALFTYEFRNQGLTHAYEPIVASGAHACTLHYQKNNAKLPKNGLVLMDIGARFQGYSADITRTYALGKPSKRETAVHKAVEKAHHEIIALIAPGVSIKKYHIAVDEIMKNALKSLDLLKKPDDYRKYFPHAISHALGLDVHDSSGAPKTFEPGMVLTVEPGIYIPEEGIGVRIEDNILVTASGHENLSASLPTAL